MSSSAAAAAAASTPASSSLSVSELRIENAKLRAEVQELRRQLGETHAVVKRTTPLDVMFGNMSATIKELVYMMAEEVMDYAHDAYKAEAATRGRLTGAAKRRLEEEGVLGPCGDDAAARKCARSTTVGFPIKPEGVESKIDSLDPEGCSYWAGNGRRQALYDSIFSKYVPSCGEPDQVLDGIRAMTEGGVVASLVYGIHAIQHEYFNNGFCNLFCNTDFEGIESKDDVLRDEFSWEYSDMLGFLCKRCSPSAGLLIEKLIVIGKEWECEEDESDDDSK